MPLILLLPRVVSIFLQNHRDVYGVQKLANAVDRSQMILLRANFIAKCAHVNLQVGRQLSAHVIAVVGHGRYPQSTFVSKAANPSDRRIKSTNAHRKLNTLPGVFLPCHCHNPAAPGCLLSFPKKNIHHQVCAQRRSPANPAHRRLPR
jgi:hypothetical protein